MKYTVITLSLVSALALGGCQTASTQSVADNIDPKNAYHDTYDVQAALAYYEPLYKTQSQKPDVALGYAQALRKTGNAQRAVVVLSSHARKKSADPMMILEFAAANLAVGRYDVAQEFAEKVLDDEHYGPRAAHLLGVTQDAQGNHRDAEQFYRQALAQWEGDPTPVMNNLALSLAHQGFLDQALEELRKAQAMAPDREEIQRNLQIVHDLRETLIPKAN